MCGRACACERYGLSERHACRLLGQGRGTQRYAPILRRDEDALTRAIITLASQYGRYGYRRITVLLQRAGWPVGKDRVRKDLATGRAESAAKTEGARAFMVERRLLRAAATGAGQPCLEL